MRGRFLILMLFLNASPAAAGSVDEEMRGDLGKTFWIEKPNNQGLNFCKRSGSNPECRIIAHTSFVVVDAVAAPGFPDYKVRLPDGSIGYVSKASRHRFLSRALTTDEQNLNAECEQRGIPTIGMTKDQVFTCMGAPIQNIITETAAGKVEQMYYGTRAGFVYVVADKVTAIQSSQ
jgi:hypothetical protein